jgi:hypothetical protein
MKYLILFNIGILLVLMGCEKRWDCEQGPIEKTVIGKWKYTEYFASPGGVGSWRKVSPANQTIEFREDGRFVAAPSFMAGANRFEVVDSSLVKIWFAPGSSGQSLLRYRIDTLKRELYLSPADFICIEGCSNKFIR